MFRLLLTIVLLSAFTQAGISQSTPADTSILAKKVSVSVNSVPLDMVFNQLSKQAGCYFTYNADMVDGDKPVSVRLNNIDLSSALDSLLQNRRFSYKVINNQLIIQPFVPLASKPMAGKKQIVVSGKVTDSESGKVLPFASMSIKNSYFGGITNKTGDFSLKIPLAFRDDTLVFSYIGYYNLVVPLKNMHNPVNIKLKPASVSLQEVIVRNVEPLWLLAKARKLMAENYFDKPYGFEAFYRESVQRNSHYMLYSEALISGYKPSNKSWSTKNKVVIRKARKFTNIKNTDTLLVKLSGGLETCFQLDLTNRLPGFLNEGAERYYKYFIRDIVVWRDEMAYVLEFKHREKLENAKFDGLIYISVNNFAIVGVEFNFAKEYLNSAHNIFVVRKSKLYKVRPINTKYYVSYASWNGKYFTKHVRGELTIKAKKRRKLFGENYTIVMEMVYTQLDTINITKPKKKILFQTSTVFSDSEYVYDPGFWQNSNVIKPEYDILDAFKKSGFKLREQGSSGLKTKNPTRF